MSGGVPHSTACASNSPVSLLLGQDSAIGNCIVSRSPGSQPADQVIAAFTGNRSVRCQRRACRPHTCGELMSKRTTFAGRIPAHDLVDQLNVVRIQTFGGPEGSGRDDRHEDGQPFEEDVYLLNHKRTCSEKSMRRNVSLLQMAAVVLFPNRRTARICAWQRPCRWRLAWRRLPGKRPDGNGAAIRSLPRCCTKDRAQSGRLNKKQARPYRHECPSRINDC